MGRVGGLGRKQAITTLRPLLLEPLAPPGAGYTEPGRGAGVVDMAVRLSYLAVRCCYCLTGPWLVRTKSFGRIHF